MNPAPLPEYIFVGGPDAEKFADDIAKLIADALKVAEHAHRNILRKYSGEPYIVHPRAVADSLPLSLRPLGLLHDVLEDNPEEYPESRLRELFPPWIVDRLVILAHKADEPYDVYLARIKLDLASSLVKIRDLRDNLKDLKPGSLRDKYRLALHFLGEIP